MSYYLVQRSSKKSKTVSAGASATFVWKTLKIGAGGFLTGLDVAADGTKVVRTDTYGAYIYGSGQWNQVVTIDSMPAGTNVGIDYQQGCFEIRIAPSNTQRLYMMYYNLVYRSDNRGVTWTRTAFSAVSADPNDFGIKLFGPFIAIDPANADIVYCSTPSNGLRVSTDAGASWSTVSGIANANLAGTQGGGHLIAFDPSSAVSGGKTQGIYATSYGHGVYHSTNGGTSFTLTTGTPTLHRHMVVASDGIVYFVPDTGTGAQVLKKFNGTSWANITVGGNGNDLYAVAVDPSDANRLVCAHAGGDLTISTDHAGTWTNYSIYTDSASPHRSATDIPWLEWTNEVFMTLGDIAFDPSLSNTLYFAEGIGFWKTNPSNSNLSVTWTSQNAGIEQLVANCVISPPGGKPVVAGWDRPVFYVNDPQIYPSTHGVDRVNSIQHGWSIDYASASPSTIVALIDNAGAVGTSGKSTDGGQTWSLFAATPPSSVIGNGGCIAASSATNYVWIPSNSTYNLYYTTNGGSSWTAVHIAGTPSSGDSGWGFAYFLDHQCVCADRVSANTFYAYNYFSAKLYRSTNSGAAWTAMSTPDFPNGGFNDKLRSVPGNAGHLFYTAGQVGNPGDANPAGGSELQRSTDGGATWSAIANVMEVYDVGFGAAAPGQSYPAIYIAGWVNNVWGIYRSIDNAVSWVKIGDYPLGLFDLVKCISGDADTYGTVYVGISGAGWVYGSYQ